MDNKLSDNTKLTIIWAALIAMNVCGWFLILGPIDVSPSCDTWVGQLISMFMLAAAAIMLIMVSTVVGICLMLPEDFFDE